ncbi:MULTISPECIES: aldolase catalytic domain-containing protein [unclassified Clostridium]|uniref:aldolase catalytic domain-containing protein n=1 Tax=unclassified Clostridium TaxID=2614128 RepID=UPI0002984227|nr:MULTISPECIES: aldolase catalytic domain-containing protein [unclassified Clostridium]EKQ51135.1 MAG: isopropylmalate/homocitrate/citramalate synthase [Clostridium sp. Maddingley MBC34-26]
MENIKILDCTLRDGGYINDWDFDSFNMNRIIRALDEAYIDIIECGYLNESAKGKEKTIVNSIEDLENRIKEFSISKDYVMMINYGEYDFNNLPNVTSKSKIRGVRIAFKKNQLNNIFNDIDVLITKGYKVFIQPMVTLSYTDMEILQLISECNKLDIYALYIVDSFGAMHTYDIKRFAYLFNHNLRKDINIGFHAHNNLQLAYTNALEIISMFNNRSIIIDSSIFGMGRGAGNLPTELITEYLNKNYCKEYQIGPILDIIDKYINRIYANKYWGYSISYYISGECNCHPNYSTYLVNKNTLSVKNILEILRDLPENKKEEFDKEYIEKLYIEFNSKNISNYTDLIEFKKDIVSKDIYILASGKSAREGAEKIIKDKNKIVISLNYVPQFISADYCFFSNQKRYEEYKEKTKNDNIFDDRNKFIFTSNIIFIEREATVVSYNELLGEYEDAKDNSVIMLLNLLIKLNINNVFICGLDGYTGNGNYIEKDMDFNFKANEINRRNIAILEQIQKLRQNIEMYFITESIYDQ